MNTVEPRRLRRFSMCENCDEDAAKPLLLSDKSERSFLFFVYFDYKYLCILMHSSKETKMRWKIRIQNRKCFPSFISGEVLKFVLMFVIIYYVTCVSSWEEKTIVWEVVIIKSTTGAMVPWCCWWRNELGFSFFSSYLKVNSVIFFSLPPHLPAFARGLCTIPAAMKHRWQSFITMLVCVEVFSEIVI